MNSPIKNNEYTLLLKLNMYFFLTLQYSTSIYKYNIINEGSSYFHSFFNPFAVESSLYPLKVLLLLTAKSGFTLQALKKSFLYAAKTRRTLSDF